MSPEESERTSKASGLLAFSCAADIAGRAVDDECNGEEGVLIG